MKIAIYSSKGSAGKTPIATNIALDRDYAIGTNEQFHIFDAFIPEERLLAVPMDEAFPPIPDGIDIVFDLAGSMSASALSIVSAIKQADLVIVPCWNHVLALNGMVGTIKEIQKFNSNILVVATKLVKQKQGKDVEQFSHWSDSRDCQNIAAAVHQYCSVDIPVLPLKFSKVFDTIIEKERSIRQLMAEDALAAHTYREVAGQFDAIYKHIDKVGSYGEQERLISA